jgi:hypothetical protein
MTKTSKKQVQDFILDGLNKGTFDGPETDVIEEAVGHHFPELDDWQIAQLVEEAVAAWGEVDHDPDSEDDDPAEDGDAAEDDDPAEDGDASEDDDPAEYGEADEDGDADEDDARDED